MDHESEQHREAARKARNWWYGLVLFGILIPVVPSLEFGLVSDSWDKLSVGWAIRSSLILLIWGELVTALPFLLYAFVVRSLIRNGWRKLRRRIYLIWWGTIGLSVPYVMLWGSFAVSYLDVLISGSGSRDMGQEFLALGFLPPAGLISGIAGLIFGVASEGIDKLVRRFFE